MPDKIKAVIFDIDGTLSSENSWGELSDNLGGRREESFEIYLAKKANQITSKEADARVMAMWTRKGLATKDNFIKILDAIPLREDAKDLVDYLRSKNMRVCIITGSNGIYAEIIAKKLGVSDYYFNATLDWDEQGNLVNMHHDSDQDAIKVIQFHEFLKKYDLKAEECAVVGDSDNDYSLFKETKKGIAVRSYMEDKIIETIAWKVIDNLSEIKNII